MTVDDVSSDPGEKRRETLGDGGEDRDEGKWRKKGEGTLGPRGPYSLHAALVPPQFCDGKKCWAHT